MIQALILQRTPVAAIRSHENLDQFSAPPETVDIVLKVATEAAYGLVRSAHEMAEAEGSTLTTAHFLRSVAHDKEAHARMKNVLAHSADLRAMTSFVEGDLGRSADLGFTAAQAFSPVPPPSTGAGPGRPRNPDLATRM